MDRNHLLLYFTEGMHNSSASCRLLVSVMGLWIINKIMNIMKKSHISFYESVSLNSCILLDNFPLCFKTHSVSELGFTSVIKWRT